MELTAVEQVRIDCARRFFSRITSDQVECDVVVTTGKLM